MTRDLLYHSFWVGRSLLDINGTIPNQTERITIPIVLTIIIITTIILPKIITMKKQLMSLLLTNTIGTASLSALMRTDWIITTTRRRIVGILRVLILQLFLVVIRRGRLMKIRNLCRSKSRLLLLCWRKKNKNYLFQEVSRSISFNLFISISLSIFHRWDLIVSLYFSFDNRTRWWIRSNTSGESTPAIQSSSSRLFYSH